MLQTIETTDTTKTNNLQKMADDKLQELNQITEAISTTILGDYKVAKGKIIDVDIPEYNMSGAYLIISAKHTIDNKAEKIDIQLKKYRESVK